MFIEQLSKDPEYFIVVCISVVLSICLHELAHGIVAIWFGDRTPIETGHMTMNPVVHMGATSLILLLVAGIAWGQMPITPKRLRGRYARSLVALAGPASNVLMAAIALTALGVWQRFETDDPQTGTALYTVQHLLFEFGLINVVLAIFNLIPIPPLDGSNLLAGLSPGIAEVMQNMRRNGQAMIVFLLIFAFAGKYITPFADHIGVTYLQWVRGG
jgi:Zn-dependent protease